MPYTTPQIRAAPLLFFFAFLIPFLNLSLLFAIQHFADVEALIQREVPPLIYLSSYLAISFEDYLNLMALRAYYGIVFIN